MRGSLFIQFSLLPVALSFILDKYSLICINLLFKTFIKLKTNFGGAGKGLKPSREF